MYFSAGLSARFLNLSRTNWREQQEKGRHGTVAVGYNRRLFLRLLTNHLLLAGCAVLQA